MTAHLPPWPADWKVAPASFPNIPDWVLDLVAAIASYEEIHAKEWDCFGGEFQAVPPDVRQFAAGWAAAKRLSRFPDPKAVCPAHGRRQCDSCAANPSTCAEDNGGCGFWRSTGMHWDTCPNRVVAGQ